MTLAVYTARIDVADPDRLDITRSGADQAARRRRPAPGAFLAPSAGLVYPALAALKAVHRAEEILGITRWAEEARAVLWERYSAAFRQEMLRSYGTVRRRGPDRAAWEALLARPRVVLVCFCVDPTRCHRTLVSGYLGRLGAEERGELRAA